MRVGYGKLIVYLGAAAGAGKTYAMLDRGNQLKDEGIDVVIGYVETHNRAETEAMIGDLPIIPRKTISVDGITYTEMDRDAVLARHPQVVLVDELAHTNAPGSVAPKRFLDVLAFLRAGINVITTLNIQHLEALSDAVFRLTGTLVRETLPDGILPLADEVILIDVTPETLRERLRAGKIYPRERIEPALANFFRIENLAALRELAIREALRAETRERIAAPFDRILAFNRGASARTCFYLRKASRIAARLEVDFAVAHIAERRDRVDDAILANSNVRRGHSMSIGSMNAASTMRPNVCWRSRVRGPKPTSRSAVRTARRAGPRATPSRAACSMRARANCSCLRARRPSTIADDTQDA